MVSVRSITVNGKKYLQVIKYEKETSKVFVLRSFGQDTLENRLKAEQFASNYNTLIEIIEKEAKNSDPENLIKGALVVFGIILGAKIISDIVDEILSE